MLRNLDRYERRDRQWYFRWRRTPMWYVTEVRDGPVGSERVREPNRPRAAAELPDAFDSYCEVYASGTGTPE